MKFKTYTGITWSMLELTGLLEDDDSHVYFERLTKHYGLHPFHLTDLNAALNEILSSNLNFYDAELKGFLLAYKNPKLLSPLGEIIYDTCFIHIDIEADFYIFRPEVGCSLKGIINKKGLDHIGVLVHKAFNVSIPKQDDEENWLGNNLEIGEEVRFKVTHFDCSSKLPFIRGILNPDDYLQGCRLIEKTRNRRKSTDNNNQENYESEDTKVLETNTKNAKQHISFVTDSENSSDEGALQIKKEISRKRKLSETFVMEELNEHNNIKKEDKNRVKKSKGVKECKPNLMEIAEFTTVKKHARKKSRDHNSQSSGDEQNNEKSGKTPKKKLNNIKLEQYTESSGSEKSRKSPKKKLSNIKLEQYTESCGSEMLEKSPKKKLSNIKLEQYTESSSSDEFGKSSKKKLSNIKLEQYTESSSSDEFGKSSKKKLSNIKLEQYTESSGSEKSRKSPKKKLTNIKLEQYTESSGSEKSRKSPKKKLTNIKLEQYTGSDSSEQIIEHVSENKVKLKKNSTKRKHLDETDNSAYDFDSDKHIKSSSRKHSKIKMADIDNMEALSNIKIEQLYEENDKIEDEIEEFINQKQCKKRNHSMKLAILESSIDSNTEKPTVKRRSKTLSMSNSEFAQNIEIKEEKVTSSSENEVYEKTNKVSKKNPDLNASYISNYDIEEDGNDNTVKSKRKKHSKKNLIDTNEIKIEPEFDDNVLKEVSDGCDNDNVTANIRGKDCAPKDAEDTSKRDLSKKQHNFDLVDISNDEIDSKYMVKHSKKTKAIDNEIESYSAKAKKKFIMNVTLDEDKIHINESDKEIKKKHRRKSLNKRLNKSINSELESDFDEIKIEETSDS
ncbi:RNA polymerase I subunit F [Ptiloglossa arizonensis]|uniref:RNA polymerase I subunit F n=1 Tax=Ptiloglossa arizonensis TaxID=3350558 RepID=UPI003F9FF72B